MTRANRPLAGVTVLDFGQVYQGPYATLLMAQAGWRPIYRDPVSALFARSGSPAARLAEVPLLVRTAPASVFP